MKKAFLLVLFVTALILLKFYLFPNKIQNKDGILYQGFISTPVYIEDSKSLAFLDCKNECNFNIIDLLSKSVTKTIENVDIAGLKYYSPNSTFIFGKNNGHELVGYSLRTKKEFEIGLKPEEFDQTLAAQGNKFNNEVFYSLNQFDKNKFTSPQMFCLTSSDSASIPNGLGKKVDIIRRVKQLGLAGTEVKYYLQIDGKDFLLRSHDGMCLVAVDNQLTNLFVVDSYGIEKIFIDK